MPNHRLPVHYSCFVPVAWFRFSQASLCSLMTGTRLSSDFTLTTVTGIWSHFWDSDWQPIPEFSFKCFSRQQEELTLAPLIFMGCFLLIQVIPNQGPLCSHGPSHLYVWISFTGQIETLIPPSSLLLLPSADYPRTIWISNQRNFIIPYLLAYWTH